MAAEYVTFVFVNHNVIVLPLAEGFAASWELQKGIIVSHLSNQTLLSNFFHLTVSLLLCIYFYCLKLDFGMTSIISDDIAAAIGSTLSDKFIMP